MTRMMCFPRQWRSIVVATSVMLSASMAAGLPAQATEPEPAVEQEVTLSVPGVDVGRFDVCVGANIGDHELVASQCQVSHELKLDGQQPTTLTLRLFGTLTHGDVQVHRYDDGPDCPGRPEVRIEGSGASVTGVQATVAGISPDGTAVNQSVPSDGPLNVTGQSGYTYACLRTPVSGDQPPSNPPEEPAPAPEPDPAPPQESPPEDSTVEAADSGARASSEETAVEPSIDPLSAELSLRRQRLGSVVSKGLRFKVRCSSQCGISGDLVLPAGKAEKLRVSSTGPAVIGRVRASADADEKRRLVIRLRRGVRKKLARAGKVRMSLNVIVSDAAGSERVLTRPVRLKR